MSDEIVKSVVSRLEDKPRQFVMYAEQTLYYSVNIDAHSLEEAQKKFEKFEFDMNYLDEEGETILTKTTEVIPANMKCENGEPSEEWVTEITLWERK